MPGKAAKVVISEMQQSVLEEIAASRTAAVRLVQRVKIILLAFRGILNEQISAEVHLNPDQVGTWRRRWQQSFESLIAVECNEGRTALRKAVEIIAGRPASQGRKAHVHRRTTGRHCRHCLRGTGRRGSSHLALVAP